MGIKFKKNNVIVPSAIIKWKFVDHPTIWTSLPQNFSNNIVVKCHYLGLPKDTKVFVINGEVDHPRVVKTVFDEEGRLVNVFDTTTSTTTLKPVKEKIQKKDESVTTTTFSFDDGFFSHNISDEKRDIPESTTTTLSIPSSKRKKDRETL